MSTERRKFARVYVGVEAEYNKKADPQKKTKVLVQDISVEGIRFITTEIFEHNCELDLKLLLNKEESPIQAKVAVIWQKKFSESFYDTGIKIINIEKKDQFLLSSHINKSASRVKEQREFIRCNLSTMVNYKLLEAENQEKRCLSVDISPSGLKVFIKEPIKENTDLMLNFNLPDTDKPIMTHGKTAWMKTREEGFFEVGIEFLPLAETDQKRINNYIKNTLGIDW